LIEKYVHKNPSLLWTHKESLSETLVGAVLYGMRKRRQLAKSLHKINNKQLKKIHELNNDTFEETSEIPIEK
jgi:endonuclease III-like uncharacterized protein